MKTNISSEKLDNTLLAELLKTLSLCFTNLGLDFFVIGATARDIVMGQLMNVESARKTKDLDIAVMINDWNRFDELSAALQNVGCTKDPSCHQRFYYNEVYELDVVPYGNIAQNDIIIWPPEEEITMSVKGFDSVFNDTLTISIDGTTDIKIASIYGLWLLKLNAWLDRCIETDKDAVDMWFIIDNYFLSNCERKVHQEVYDFPDFSETVAGATWLAYDVATLLNKEQLIYYKDSIAKDIGKNEESRLINQILDNNRIRYEEVESTWEHIVSTFENEINNRYNEHHI